MVASCLKIFPQNQYGNVGFARQRNNTCFKDTALARNCCNRKILAATLFITALATLIIGAIALAGCQFPASSIGTVGSFFGQPGAIAAVATGGTVISLFAALFSCRSIMKNRKERQMTVEDSGESQ